jgi:hypothetical protein
MRVTSRGAQDFQDPKNIVNIIFDGDGGFPTKRVQKLTLREILFVEPATQKSLLTPFLACVKFSVRKK